MMSRLHLLQLLLLLLKLRLQVDICILRYIISTINRKIVFMIINIA